MGIYPQWEYTVYLRTDFCRVSTEKWFCDPEESDEWPGTGEHPFKKIWQFKDETCRRSLRATDDNDGRLGGYQIADECGFYFNPLCIGSGQGRCPLTRIKRPRSALSYLYSSRKCRINLDISASHLALVRSLSSGISFRSFVAWHRSAENPSSHFVVDMRRFAYPAHFFLLNLCMLHLQFSAKFQ